MRQRGRRTKGMEEAHPFMGMSQVNANAAGVDIGAEEIVVCVAVVTRTSNKNRRERARSFERDVKH